MSFLVVPVTHVARATPRAAIVRIRVPEGELSFAPGQAMSLGRHGQPGAKFYSIASAPNDVRRTGEVEFLVGTREDGLFDDHLAGIVPGALVDLKGPFGAFGLPADPHPACFVLVAGGTGIAPLRSMWRHVLEGRADTRVAVLYSARTRAHFAYRDELEELEASHRLSLTLTTTREPAQPGGESPGDQAVRGIRLQPDSTGGQRDSPRPVLSGRICRSHLEGPVARGPAVYLLCGPPAFVAHVESLLAGLGVALELIRKEGW